MLLIKPIPGHHSKLTPVAVLIILLFSAYFVATQPITPQLAIVSSISVILFALPSYWAVVRLQGIRRGLSALLILGSYALLVESSALATGFPYGDFTYTDVLGNKVFGLTPWTVAFAYPPILLLSYLAAGNVMRRFKPSTNVMLGLQTAALTAVFALTCDIVLDPAAVRLGFWYWNEPGWFYGVPLVNFAGWLLSGFVGGLIMHWLVDKVLRLGNQVLPPALGNSGLATVWFWTAVNGWLGQWWPTAIGLLLSFFLFHILQNFDSRTDKNVFV